MIDKRNPRISTNTLNRSQQSSGTLRRLAGGSGIVSPSFVSLGHRVAVDLAMLAFKIFEVDSILAIPSDGWYRCYEKNLDATYIADTTGHYRFCSAGGDLIPVFNLYENDPVSDYTPALGLYDCLMAWKWKDDEGTSRWVGIPLTPQTRIVFAAENAPATDVDTTSITCNLLLNNGVEAGEGELGYHIEVYGSCVGGEANWDEVVPKIIDTEKLTAQCMQGIWGFTTEFSLGGIRRAYCKDNAGASTSIDCYLDIDGTGTIVSVHFEIAGGGNCNMASPKMTDGRLIYVNYDGTQWNCIHPLSGHEDCDCYSA